MDMDYIEVNLTMLLHDLNLHSPSLFNGSEMVANSGHGAGRIQCMMSNRKRNLLALFQACPRVFKLARVLLQVDTTTCLPHCATSLVVTPSFLGLHC